MLNKNNVSFNENCLLPTKNVSDKHGIAFLYICLMTGLMEDSWILLFTHAFNLLLYHTPCSLWRTVLQIWEKNESEMANCVLILFGVSFDLRSSGLEDLQDIYMWCFPRVATHSSVLAWKIPWTEKPGGLQSMGPHRVGHDCVTEHMYDTWRAILKRSIYLFTFGCAASSLLHAGFL